MENINCLNHIFVVTHNKYDVQIKCNLCGFVKVPFLSNLPQEPRSSKSDSKVLNA